jgi:hypothetical protein
VEYLHTTFLKLLAGEISDPDTAALSCRFEVIASRLLHSLRPRHWFDGVVEMRYQRRKERQIVFTGRMWVGDGTRLWQEGFEARLTDMRATRQGIQVTLRIGEFTAMGELYELEQAS